MQGDDVMDAELEIQRERGMEMRRTAMWRVRSFEPRTAPWPRPRAPSAPIH